MQRLKRRLFKTKKSIEIEREDEEVYLEPQFSETESITLHIDSVAEELLAIAKKSVNSLFLMRFHLTWHCFLVSYNSFIETLR